MTYVNVNGKRINLSRISGYSLDGSMVIVDTGLSDSEDVICDVLKFSSEEEAQQCIGFLDLQTKCKKFVFTATKIVNHKRLR